MSKPTSFDVPDRSNWPGPVVHLELAANAAPFFTALLCNEPMADVPVILGTVSPRGPLQEQVAARGIPTFSLSASARSEYPKAIVRLARWLHAIDASIVHAHELDAVLIGLTAARLAGTPVTVYTAHHSHELPVHGSKLVLAERLCARVLADHVIAPSNDVAGTLRQYTGIPPERLHVVAHGFDPEGWERDESGRQRVRSELGLEDALVIGVVGRSYRIKNLPAMIEGFATTAREHPEAHLVVIGGGDQSELAALASSLGISDRVHTVGPRTDMKAVFSAFDLFVHPSLAESFGMVIIEAMLIGVPTLSTPVGVAAEVIAPGVNGLLLEAGSGPDQIARGLRSMLAAQARWPTFSQAGRASALQYSGAEMASRYAELYRDWLGINS